MDNKKPSEFTIRVYGLILNSDNEVLVTDEFQLDTKMTKFPGGGLEFGEGTIDCLKREMIEECNQEITDIQHFYTTDFFQKALFWDNHQLLSIYYLAKLVDPVQFRVSTKAFDFFPIQNGKQSFRWISPVSLIPEEFTFPIDKHVAHLLKEYLSARC